MVESIEKKEKKYKDFYQDLREKINQWGQDGRLAKKTGKWIDKFLQYLLVFPDFVHLLIKLLVDNEISALIKSYILVALLYVFSPLDIIPDFIPVAGFIDDLLVVVVLLNKIINTESKNTLNKIKTYWAGEEDVFLKVKEIITIMNDLSSQIPKSIYKFMKKKN
jgi:uncharacterized membrane protein YkvA (DUF1232 family)